MAVHVPAFRRSDHGSQTVDDGDPQYLFRLPVESRSLPSQDIVLGSYFLTMNPKAGESKPEEKCPLIGSLEEAMGALQEGVLNLHDWIDLKNLDKGWKPSLEFPRERS